MTTTAHMISFVVPAHNEQALLAATLEAIHRTGCQLRLRYEVLVVDDASTDATRQIAWQHGARVLSVHHRQIAATRNSGGRAAVGEILFFIDADTLCDAKAVYFALRAIDRGAVGGGAPTWPDPREQLPAYARIVGLFSVLFPKLAGFTGGAFMFCTREAFRATGGFSERVFWGEEAFFALSLKREGRFVVLWNRVTTSGRRFRKVAGLELLFGALACVVSPINMFTRRSAVQGVWYDSDRSTDDEMPSGIATRFGNAVVTLILILLLTSPLWSFVPWSATPSGSLLHAIRTVTGAVLAHLELAFWPVGFVLAANLVSQKRWTSVLHSLALITFFFWQGWCAARVVFSLWNGLLH